jgi:hypothetical protein
MSILVLKWKPCNIESKSCRRYWIHRMSEDLRVRKVWFSSRDLVIEGLKGPGFARGSPNIFYIRGIDRSRDALQLHINKEEWDILEKGVLAFNKSISNNSHLTMDDVIWREDEA